MEINEFKEELAKLNIEIDENKLNKLELYYNLLIEWNEKINLTSITEKKDVYLKHFYDSLTVVKVIDLKEIKTLCDIGTGAGFPGVVLKIIFPNLKLVLVDSLNKRIEFLKVVCKKLGLENVEFVHSRIEDYAKNNKELFDVVTSRAVAQMPILLELSAPLLKVNASFIALKGKNSELNLCDNALKKLNLKVLNEEKFLLPKEQSERCIVRIIKEKSTGLKYPRKYSEIKKFPL